MPVTANWPSAPEPSNEGYSFTYNPRVRSAMFGDGYELRTPDGTNNNPRSFNLTWPNLEASDYATINNFLVAREGSEAFNWTPPHEGSSIKVKCPQWTPTPGPGGVYWSISATFVQVFDQ